MAKKNPLKLNALQLRTLVILQQMARSPNHAQPGDEEGSVMVGNFPHAHGDHFHVGRAVVLARDATGLANPNVMNALVRKGLLLGGPAGMPILTSAGLDYDTGIAVFEATHGTAPKYANQDKVNPGSVILSGEMMFRYMGWDEAADAIIRGLEGAIAARTVTYDFERLMEGATKVSTSEFGEAVVSHI